MTYLARQRTSEKSAFKWLIFIGLLIAQFAYASHLPAHDIDELGEACQVCTSFQNFEDAVSDTGVSPAMPAASIALPFHFSEVEVAEYSRVFSARAPPGNFHSSS